MNIREIYLFYGCMAAVISDIYSNRQKNFVQRFGILFARRAS